MTTKELAELLGKKKRLAVLTKVADTEIQSGTTKTGSIRNGFATKIPEKGEYFVLDCGMNKFQSELVLKVNDDCTFETVDSIFKLEIPDAPEPIVPPVTPPQNKRSQTA
jgi:hypothetical protein